MIELISQVHVQFEALETIGPWWNDLDNRLNSRDYSRDSCRFYYKKSETSMLVLPEYQQFLWDKWPFGPSCKQVGQIMHRYSPVNRRHHGELKF